MQCQPAEDAGLDPYIFLAYNFSDRKMGMREDAGVSPTAHPCRASLGSVERAGYFPASGAIAAAHPALVQLLGGANDVITASLDALPVDTDGEGLWATQCPIDHLGKGMQSRNQGMSSDMG